MKSIEIYGFIGWISSYLLSIVYVAWVLLPDNALNALGIHYFPSKYWALALPSLIVVTIFTIILGYALFNYAMSNTFDSYSNIEDKYSRFLNLKKTELHEGLPEVYDIPANVVNNVVYWQPELIQRYIPS